MSTMRRLVLPLVAALLLFTAGAQSSAGDTFNVDWAGVGEIVPRTPQYRTVSPSASISPSGEPCSSKKEEHH